MGFLGDQHKVGGRQWKEVGGSGGSSGAGQGGEEGVKWRE
jgi:hypothetical protein